MFPSMLPAAASKEGSAITDRQAFAFLLSLIYETLPFPSFPMVPSKRKCETGPFRKISSSSLLHRGQTLELATIQIHSVMYSILYPKHV